MMTPASNPMPPIGFTLPLVGEDHPLRKSFQRTFLWSATMAMLIHVAVAGSRIAVSRPVEAPRTPIEIHFTIGPPPSIIPTKTLLSQSLAKQVTQPSFAIPDPVPDFDAKELIFPSADNAVAPNNGPNDVASSLTGDEVLPVVSSGDAIPSPDQYVAVEELPQLINAAEVQQATIDLYPEIAKSAGVEGTVNVKVYIGKTGDVENVIVVDGPLMLRDAATQVVKLAKFKPALQQHHPVGIWVAWPVEFSLQY